MDFRSVLVHLDDSPRCAVRTAIAASIARDHGGHLLGLSPAGVVDVPARVSHSLSGGPDYLDQARQQLHQKASLRAESFKSIAIESGLASFEARIEEERPFESVLMHGRNQDLIVMGQADPGAAGAELAWNLAQQVLMRAGRPVLAIPHEGSFPSVGTRVLVAWKDSRESARALQDALPFLRRAGRVDVLCIESPAELRHVKRAQLDALRDGLRRHGVEAHLHREVTEAHVGDLILSRCRDLDADLLVTGAYGRSRMAEFILGGVTRTLLVRMKIPVLFSH